MLNYSKFPAYFPVEIADQVINYAKAAQADPFTKGTIHPTANDLKPEARSILIDMLAESGTSLKNKYRFLCDETPTREYKPIPTNYKKVGKQLILTPVDVVKALSNMVANDPLRPCMNTVYFDTINKNIVATDAHKLICIHAHKTLECFSEPTLIHASTGERHPDGSYQLGRFPRYKEVIRTVNQYEAGVSVSSLLAVSEAAVKVGKVFRDSVACVLLIDLPDGNQWYCNPQLMVDTCKALLSFGIGYCTARFNSPNQAIQLHSDTCGSVAIVMPYYVENWEESNTKFVRYIVF